MTPRTKEFYHGGDLVGLINRGLDYIQGLGTTAIWLAPVFKNRPVQDIPIVGGLPRLLDHRLHQVDPHFGTNEELKRLVRLAHQRGIKVFLDMIINHTADVIYYRENSTRTSTKRRLHTWDATGTPF